MAGTSSDHPSQSTVPRDPSARRVLLEASSLGLGEPCPFCGALLGGQATRCPQCGRVVVRDPAFD
jgi:hypothetical protein